MLRRASSFGRKKPKGKNSGPWQMSNKTFPIEQRSFAQELIHKYNTASKKNKQDALRKITSAYNRMHKAETAYINAKRRIDQKFMSEFNTNIHKVRSFRESLGPR